MKTLQDISREAGVSISTVSRVLNNSGYTSKATREKVQRAAIGYIPNALAQSMVSGQTKTIGIAINCKPEYFFMNDFYSKVLLGISETLNQKQYRMLFIMNETDEELLRLYFNRRVDGFVLIGGYKNVDMVQALKANQVPFVVLGNDVYPGMKVPCVEIDNFKFAYEMVVYLIQLGHRRIGMISGSFSNGSFAERVNGYRQALADYEIPFEEEYLQVCEYSIEDEAENLAKKLLYMPEPVTAIFGANDLIAVSVYRAAEALGLKIPEDISVAGFDDNQIAQYISPPLTTVWQPSLQKGAQAAQILFDMLANGSRPESMPELKCYIQYRKSCMPPKGKEQ